MAIWLDSQRTSGEGIFSVLDAHGRPRRRERYQFFTFLSENEIAAIVSEHQKSPEKRAAQRELAKSVTTLIHGANVAKREADKLMGYSGKISGAQLLDHFSEESNLPKAPLLKARRFRKLTVHACLATSKLQARQLITGGGLYEWLLSRREPENHGSRHLRHEKFIQRKKGKKTRTS